MVVKAVSPGRSRCFCGVRRSYGFWKGEDKKKIHVIKKGGTKKNKWTQNRTKKALGVGLNPGE